MLRITELRLPLLHADEALRPALLARLGLPDAALKAFTVFRRAYDARRKAAVVLIYTIDCELRSESEETAALARHAGDAHVRRAPDTGYSFVGHAPVDFGAFAAFASTRDRKSTRLNSSHRP